jgi:hypothetical protein
MLFKNSLSEIHIGRGLVVLKLNYISMTTLTKRKTLGQLHLLNIWTIKAKYEPQLNISSTTSTFCETRLLNKKTTLKGHPSPHTFMAMKH